MKSLKFNLIAISILIVLILAVSRQVEHNKRVRAEAEAERVQSNNLQLMAQDRRNTNLLLTQKEFIGIISDSLQSTLKTLNIRPKTVIKIIEKEVIIHDTIETKVYVQTTGKDQWFIEDFDKCWDWKAIAYLWNDSLMVTRTEFNYHNKTEDIFNWERPHKFLFIRWGKKEIIQTSSSECGETTSHTIKVLKR